MVFYYTDTFSKYIPNISILSEKNAGVCLVRCSIHNTNSDIVFFSLMFVPCIIRHSRNNQHYALNCITPIFNIQAATYFGSGLPSCGLCACTPAHRPHKHALYDTPPIRSAFQVSQMNPRSSLMMADYCWNMQEPVYWIKEWYNSVHSVGCFC
jgi:hypothetical protein